MAQLFNMDSNEEISRYVSLEPEQKQISVIQQALDGVYHIQHIGNPAVSYTVTVYVDRAGKTLLLSAESSASLLRAVVLHGTYYGRITALKFGNRLPCDWFKAELTLAAEVLT